jgi:hypothetical protein
MRTAHAARSLLPTFAFTLIGAVSMPATAADPDGPDRPPGATRVIDYARDVRPILESRCYACHGPKKQKAGLRLDEKAAAMRGGSDGVEAIRPGQGDESELIRRVTSRDPEERMPPEGERLTPEQVGTLRGWIDQGAIWPESAGASDQARAHWAFRPPVRPAVPAVRGRNWARTPIDRFILARLEAEGLSPSPEAERSTLLRRLSLDLNGLPPSVEEVESFVADPRADAYERAVERQLASPHHGECWGRPWLDAARYADSDGYEKDKSRFVWFYRDWVINALNRDLPYDRFIIEQIAGDQLPGASQDQVVATGFLRNSMINEEGGIDPEQFRMEAMFDRMDAIGKGVLGLTIQCAQCHSHKYDPISQEEYYRLFAFLNNDHESQPVVYTPSQLRTVAELSGRIREVEEGLKHTSPDWRARMAAWEASVKGGQPRWVVLSPTQVSEADTRFIPQDDGSLLAQGYAPAKFTYDFEATCKLSEIRAFRIELFTDPNLPANGPGRSFKGTCTLSEFEVEAADARAGYENKQRVKLVKATADYANEDRELERNFDDRSGRKRITGRVEFAIDGKRDTAWGIDAGPGRRNTDRKAVFVAEDDVAFPAGTVLTFHLVSNHGGWNNNDHQQANLGRFRLSVTDARDAQADPVPRRVREIFEIPPARRSPVQQAVVFSYWRTTVPEFKEANDRIEALYRRWPEGTTALTLMAREQGRTTALLKRGDWLKPGKAVTPGVPAILHPLPDGCEPTRLAFARWLVDRRSPTTARVLVNRVWQSYFATGLVSTSEDLGTQGEAPSHRELLDWLACEFMDRGWSLKELHRLIVGSAVYRQSSRVTPELLARDPANRLLARSPRFRVDAEIVRDIALASSGLLNPRLGGPSIYAPAPAFLFLPPASYAPFPWKEETGPDRYRRAVYTFRRRSTPYPVLSTFDAPNGDASCVRRTRSNTPLQALTTLNETVFVECARALAGEILEHGGPTDGERVDYAFRRVLGRRPTGEERAVLLGLLEAQSRRIAEGRLDPRDLADGPDARAGSSRGSPAQFAAYMVVSRVILNLDETITKE